MQNEQQLSDKLIFKAGKVFLESQGEQKPIETVVVDTNSLTGAKFVSTLTNAAADYAELNGR